MAELEEKLGAILNNPQAMAQIMSLAQSLGGGDRAAAAQPSGGERASAPAAQSLSGHDHASVPPRSPDGDGHAPTAAARLLEEDGRVFEAVEPQADRSPSLSILPREAEGEGWGQGGETVGEAQGQGGETEGLGLDPRLVAIGMKVLSAYQGQDNQRAALLQALRPFVKPERYAKVDKAVQIAKLAKAVRVGLDGVLGGGEHV